jgi:hypothetical protein
MRSLSNAYLSSTLLILVASACGARTPPDLDEAGGGGGATPATSGYTGTGAVGEGGSGGAGGGDPDPLPVPTMLFVETPDACGLEVPVGDAENVLRPIEAGDDVAVVELLFADECTGAGGNHILLRTLDGSREFWLGSHACYFFDFALVDGVFRFGVVRYAQTASLFHTSPGTCIGWPGEPEGLTSDSRTRAVGVFASLEDAQAFADGAD